MDFTKINIKDTDNTIKESVEVYNELQKTNSSVIQQIQKEMKDTMDKEILDSLQSGSKTSL